MKGYMYILECCDGSYYTGSTKDLDRRLEQHQTGEGANHTKKRLPVKLVYYEEFDRIDTAFYREKQVQGWSRKKKEALINRTVDKLNELAGCKNKSHHSNVAFDSAQATALAVVEWSRNNIPKLRFPEFGEEWIKSRLGDISTFISKGTTPIRFSSEGVRFVKIESLNGINIIKEKCLFIDKEIHSKELKRSILEEHDILFAIAGATVGKIGIVTKDILPANTNQALAIIRLSNKKQVDFLINILDSQVMKKYIQLSISVGAQPNLNLQQINDFKFIQPSLPEQQKIASFLTSVDTKIEQLTRKKNLLEQYKKGVMQQIFPSGDGQVPQLRFAFDSAQATKFDSAQATKFDSAQGVKVVERSRNHPDWEEKKLGEILKIGNGRDYKHLKNGKIPVFGTGGLMTTVDDFLYDGESVCIGRKGTIDKPVYLNGKFWTVDTLFYTHSFVQCLPKFIFYKFQCINWKKYNEASGVPSLSKATIEKINISIPCLEEQTQIANFLSAIDTKIELVNTQLENTQQFKKGLLQQMFV